MTLSLFYAALLPLLSWLTVEHAFAHAKRFQILGGPGVFRGRVSQRRSGFLYRASRIVYAILAMRVRYFTPLRVHHPIPPADPADEAAVAADPDDPQHLSDDEGPDGPEEDDDEEPAAAAEGKEEKKDAAVPAGPQRGAAGPRHSVEADFQLLPGMRLGSSLDYKRSRRHGTSGLVPEPSNAAVDHGHSVRCFRVNERVLVWWWSLYWPARVQAIRQRAGTVTIRWERDRVVTAGYLPRLLFKIKDADAFCH